MRKIAYLLLMVGLGSRAFGQNLVLNPSFEDYTACPNLSGDVNKAIGWDTCRASPDYFNICSSVSAAQVPTNYFGNQSAASGNAYGGFWCFDPSGLYREFMVGTLTSPLNIGQKYFISLKVNRADSNYVAACYSVNKLGAKFSTTKESNVQINNTAHYFDSTVIMDTVNWTKVFGSFIADSSYQFIMLGVFFDDANISVVNDCLNGGAYYYVDDICVSTDSTFTYNYSYVTGVEKYSPIETIDIFPNPANDFFSVRSNSSTEGEIINLIG